MNITIKPLSAELLNDFLYFFDNITFTEHPDWSICYCYSYHFTGTDEQWNKESNRASAIRYIREGKMKGYIAFLKDKPVGWCNANDRKNYERIIKYQGTAKPEDGRIASIVCFLIAPGYRRRGIAEQLLGRVCEDYSAEKYDYLEAYPRKDTLSDEKNYHGPMALYEKYDFSIVDEKDDFYIVRRKLTHV
ncbi:MAG: GNAT family N-acetyltransferase [Spirochaetales bacterium]|nr:GNAT family N-acetyltransferase [Spirochaetales bacterium]